MSKDVNFKINLQIDGKDKVVQASTSVKELGKAVRDTKSEAERGFNLTSFTNLTVSLKNVADIAAQLHSQLNGLYTAYQAQISAETKLATVMKQRMGASEQDVQSILRLTAAQQQLGIIGDEVQLAGAQQIATFLSQKSSLELLIPAMNNLLAQQRDFNASQGDAVSVGNMIGKVMQGQTEALTRVGITFTEAQKKALQFGDEQQRAATLAQVITDNVGQMNAQLAATNAGRLTQMNNEIGDIKEEFGEMLVPVSKVVTGLNEVCQFAAPILLVAWSTGKAVVAIKSWSGFAAIGAVNTRIAASASTLLSRSFMGITINAGLASVAVRTLTWSLRALEAATVVGSIIAAVSIGVELLGYAFSSTSDEAADAADQIKKANEGIGNSMSATQSIQQHYQQQSEQTFASLMGDYVRLQAEWKRLSDDHARNAWIKQNQDAFRRLGLSINGVTDAENAFVKNTESVVEAIKRRAEAAALQASLEEAYKRKIELENKIRKADNAAQQRHANDGKNAPANASLPQPALASQLGISQPSIGIPQQQPNIRPQKIRYVSNSAETRRYRAELADTNEFIGTASQRLAQMQQTPTPNAPSTTTPASTPNPTATENTPTLVIDPKTYADLANNVQFYDEALRNCDVSNTELIQTLARQREEAKRAMEAFDQTAEASLVSEDPKTIEDITRRVSLLENKKKSASEEEIRSINDEILALNKKKQALEDASSFRPKPTGELQTYEELDEAAEFYAQQVQKGTAEVRRSAQQQIDEINRIRAAWQEADRSVSTPLPPERLNSLKELEEAVTFYSEKQRKQNADEAAQTQTLIDAYNRRIAAIRLSTGELTTMKEEMQDMLSLSRQDYVVKVRQIGLDGVLDKIRELERLLENPNLTATQRQQLQALKSQWAAAASSAVSSMELFRNGWSGVKGISSGITSMTEALKSNTTVWEKAVSIVDAALSIYDGIAAIANIISTVAKVNTASKMGEVAAIQTANIANVEGAAITASTSAANAASMKLETKAATELAAAKLYAAYASIPFAGNAIAAGFVAEMLVQVKAAGLAAAAFAQGGVVSGPTLALIGEYSSARSNPEIVAPLDRLRSILRQEGGGMGGRVEFKIRGRRLVGILNKEERLMTRR